MTGSIGSTKENQNSNPLFTYLVLFSLIVFFVLQCVWESEYPAWLSLIRLLWSLGFAGLFLLFRNASVGVMLPLIFVFQFSMAYLLQSATYIHTEDYFSVYSGDGVLYFDIGTWPEWLSLENIQKQLKSGVTYDDMGMVSVIRLTRLLAGGNVQTFCTLLLLFNALAVTISSAFLNKFFRLFADEKLSKTAMLFFGLCIYFPFSSALFLKENFFVTLIILASYYLLKTVDKSSPENLFYFILFTAMTFLFRGAIPFMFLITFIGGKYFSNLFFGKKFIFFFLAGVAVTCLLFPLFIKMLQLLVPNVSLENITATGEYRRGQLSENAVLSMIIMTIGSLVGPFAQLKEVENSPLALYGLYFVVKALLSFFFFFGLYDMFKEKHKFFPPLLIYLSLSMALMILPGVGLDFRYQLTYYPLFLAVCLYGYIKRDSGNTFFSLQKFSFLIYSAGVLVLLLLYNLRGA